MFVYLHGFASSPGSKKATMFRRTFADLGIDLLVPDLENGDFQNITISRQIDVVKECMDRFPGHRFGVIGSSMGGYLSILLAQLRPEITALYLMAPGFNFLKRWSERLGYDSQNPEAIPALIPVFHYHYNEEKMLSQAIFRDAETWDKLSLQRKLSTRLVHGIHDDTVPIEQSRNFVKTHPWCRLKELDSDHSLISHIDWMVSDCLEFFRESGTL